MTVVAVYLAGRGATHNPVLTQAITSVVARLSGVEEALLGRESLLSELSRFPFIEIKHATPYDASRAAVGEQAIAEFFRNAKSKLDNIENWRIANLDESGFHCWADAKKVRVFSRPEIKSPRYAAKRNGGKASALFCITLSGECVKPLITLPTKSMPSCLAKNGYGSDCALFRHTAKAYVNEEVFREWVSCCLAPFWRRRREEEKMEGARCFVVMDNFSAHSAAAATCLEDFNVEPVWLPAHSSDRLQPLDVGVFGPMKGYMRCDVTSVQVPPECAAAYGEQLTQIAKIVNSFQKAALRDNIVSAFRACGIGCTVRSQQGKDNVVAVVDRGMAKFALPPGAVVAAAPANIPRQKPKRQRMPKCQFGRRLAGQVQTTDQEQQAKKPRSEVARTIAEPVTLIHT